MAQILISNKSTMAKAEILSVLDDGHVFSIKESMQRFIESGGEPSKWGRKFSIVHVKNKSVAELSFLNETLIDSFVKRWAFIEPATTTSEWMELYKSGAVSRDWTVVSKYLIERK